MSQTADSHKSSLVLPEELRGVHRVRQSRFLTIYPRLMIAASAVGVLLFVRGEMWPPAVVWGVLLPSFVVAEVLRRRERVELHAAGVSIHGGFRPSHLAWEDVLSIKAPDRWRGEAVLHLAGGREVALRGVDDKTARGLTGWFDQMASMPAR